MASGAGNPHGVMLDFADNPGPPEAALWCAVLVRAWEDLQHPNARIRRDVEAFFAGPGFDRIAALTRLEWEAIALIRETARQQATGHSAPVSKFASKSTRTYQRRAHYLVRHLEYQGKRSRNPRVDGSGAVDLPCICRGGRQRHGVERLSPIRLG